MAALIIIILIAAAATNISLSLWNRSIIAKNIVALFLVAEMRTSLRLVGRSAVVLLLLVYDFPVAFDECMRLKQARSS